MLLYNDFGGLFFSKITDKEKSPFVERITDKFKTNNHLADSLFNLDAVCGILKDSTRKKLSIIEQTDLNLNALGGYTGVTYNYTGVATGDYCYIDDVRVSKNVANRGDFQNLNPNVFSAFVDFELHNYRMPRA